MREGLYYRFRTAHWTSSPAALLFLLWSLWLAFEYFGFGVYSYVRIHDNGDSILPAKLAVAAPLARSLFQYWSPQWLSGTDRLAGAFVNELDSVLFSVMPGWLAFGMIMWIQRLIAGYFTFRLLKEYLDLDTLASLYAGFAYSLFAQGAINAQWSGFTLYDGLSLPGLPFALWAIHRLGARGDRWSYLYAAGLGILFSVTSYYALALFLMPVVFLWFLFVAPGSTKKTWIMISLFVAAWVLSELPIVWASFLNAPFSHRADWDLTNPLFGGWGRQLAVVRGLILDNALPLGLALLGLVLSRARDRRLVSLFGAAILCFGLVFGFRLLQLQGQDYLGFLSGFQFDRIYLVAPFLSIAAGAAGLHLIGEKWRIQLKKESAFSFGASLRSLVLAAVIGLLLWQSLVVKERTLIEMSDGSNFASLYRQPDLQRLAQKRKGRFPFRVATIADSQMHPAYVWSYGLDSADGYVPMYSQRYQDYWEQVIFPLTTVDKARYEYFHYWGSRVYLFSPSAGFPRVAEDQPLVTFSKYYDLELLSLANVRYIVSSLPLEDENLQELVSSARGRQTAWEGKARRDKLLGMLLGRYPGRPMYVYENRRVLPRFFLVGQVRLFDNADQALTALREADYEDLRSTAYLESADTADLRLDPISGNGGDVRIDRYSSDWIDLEVEAEGPSILILASNYSPYWKVWVDGDPARIFPVDHAFQGIYVQGGRHKVVLKYAPSYTIRFNWLD